MKRSTSLRAHAASCVGGRCVVRKGWKAQCWRPVSRDGVAEKPRVASARRQSSASLKMKCRAVTSGAKAGGEAATAQGRPRSRRGAAGNCPRSADFQVCCIAGFQTRGRSGHPQRCGLSHAPETSRPLPIWKSATQQVWKPALRGRYADAPHAPETEWCVVGISDLPIIPTDSYRPTARTVFSHPAPILVLEPAWSLSLPLSFAAVVSMDDTQQRLTTELAMRRNHWIARHAAHIVVAEASPDGSLISCVVKWKSEGDRVSILLNGVENQ